VRKTPIPRRELKVLKRLREAREHLDLDQGSFARQVGISRGRLANYEYGKAPLPCELAFRICNQFIIGERWLATGDGPLRQLMFLELASKRLAPYGMPFGEAYDNFYADVAEKEAKELDSTRVLFAMGNIFYSNPADSKFYNNFLNALLEHWIGRLKEEGKDYDVGELVGRIAELGNDCLWDILDRELKSDPETKEFYWESKSTGKKTKTDPPFRSKV
jgi:transcriptional regulator with XRE-family HTH domain